MPDLTPHHHDGKDSTMNNPMTDRETLAFIRGYTAALNSEQVKVMVRALGADLYDESRVGEVDFAQAEAVAAYRERLEHHGYEVEAVGGRRADA